MRERDLDQIVKQQVLETEKMKELILCKTVHEEEGTLPVAPCGKICLN